MGRRLFTLFCLFACDNNPLGDFEHIDSGFEPTEVRQITIANSELRAGSDTTLKNDRGTATVPAGAGVQSDQAYLISSDEDFYGSQGSQHFYLADRNGTASDVYSFDTGVTYTLDLDRYNIPSGNTNSAIVILSVMRDGGRENFILPSDLVTIRDSQAIFTLKDTNIIIGIVASAVPEGFETYAPPPESDTQPPTSAEVLSWTWILSSPSNGTLNHDNTPQITMSGANPENGGSVQIYDDASCTSSQGATQTITAGSTVHTDISYRTDGTDDGVKTFRVIASDAVNNSSVCIDLPLSYTLQILPIAVGDQYTGTSGAIGNTQLTVSASNGLITNDSDPNSQSLSVVAETVTTTLSGSVTISSDGSFVYSPPAGISGATDGFTYRLQNPQATHSGSVSVQIMDRIWYVKNDGGGGDGRSHNPFSTLAEAATASSVGDTIYIFEGSGDDTGQNNGITLKNNQKLIGAGVDLKHQGTLLQPSTTHPVISNQTGGSGITLADGNEIRGVRVENTLNDSIFGTTVNGLVLEDLQVLGTGSTSSHGLAITDFRGNLRILRSNFQAQFGDFGDGIQIATLGDQTVDAVIALNTFDVSGGNALANAIYVNPGTTAGSADQTIRILENTISESSGSTDFGVFVEAENALTPDIVIARNTISNVDSNGVRVFLRNTTLARTEISRNSISGSGAAPVRIRNYDTSSSHSQIRGNTVSGTTGGISASAGSGGSLVEIEGNTVSGNGGTLIFTSDSGAGQSHYYVRNNTVSGSPSYGFEVTYTSGGGGGDTCLRFIGNNASGVATTSLRTNQEGGSSQVAEDITSTGSFNSSIQASNTGFSSFYHVNAQPTLVADGTCTLVDSRPTISSITNQSLPMNGSLTGLAFTVSDVEDSDSSLTAAAVSYNTELVPNASMTVNHLGGMNRSIDVTPSSNRTGIATILVTVTDSDSLVGVELFQLTVN